MKKTLQIVLLFLSVFILFFVFFNKKTDLRPNFNKEFFECGFLKTNYFECDLTIKSAEFPFLSQKGKMYTSKPNNIFIINSSLEIGLNENYFWFWSKYYNPKNLYFCTSEELENSRLKKSLNPLIFKKILTLSEIKSFSKIDQYEENFKIGNENFKLFTFLQKTNDEFIIYKKFYKNDKLAIETSTTEFQIINNKIFPKKIIINWIEENLKSIWLLDDLLLEKEKRWKIPNSKNKISIKN